MKLAIILAGALLLSGCAAKTGGQALLPSRSVIFQHCIVTARDEDGKALSCQCPKLSWATDAKTGRAVALCTE